MRWELTIFATTTFLAGQLWSTPEETWFASEETTPTKSSVAGWEYYEEYENGGPHRVASTAAAAELPMLLAIFASAQIAWVSESPRRITVVRATLATLLAKLVLHARPSAAQSAAFDVALATLVVAIALQLGCLAVCLAVVPEAKARPGCSACLLHQCLVAALTLAAWQPLSGTAWQLQSLASWLAACLFSRQCLHGRRRSLEIACQRSVASPTPIRSIRLVFLRFARLLPLPCVSLMTSAPIWCADTMLARVVHLDVVQPVGASQSLDEDFTDQQWVLQPSVVAVSMLMMSLSGVALWLAPVAHQAEQDICELHQAIVSLALSWNTRSWSNFKLCLDRYGTVSTVTNESSMLKALMPAFSCESVRIGKIADCNGRSDTRLEGGPSASVSSCSRKGHRTTTLAGSVSKSIATFEAKCRKVASDSCDTRSPALAARAAKHPPSIRNQQAREMADAQDDNFTVRREPSVQKAALPSIQKAVVLQDNACTLPNSAIQRRNFSTGFATSKCEIENHALSPRCNIASKHISARAASPLPSVGSAGSKYELESRASSPRCNGASKNNSLRAVSPLRKENVQPFSKQAFGAGSVTTSTKLECSDKKHQITAVDQWRPLQRQVAGMQPKALLQKQSASLQQNCGVFPTCATVPKKLEVYVDEEFAKTKSEDIPRAALDVPTRDAADEMHVNVMESLQHQLEAVRKLRNAGWADGDASRVQWVLQNTRLEPSVAHRARAAMAAV